MKPKCKKCLDSGEIWLPNPSGDPQLDVSVPCDCPEGRA